MQCGRFRLFLGGLACLLASSTSFGDTLFNYPGFSDSTGLTLVGNTATTTTADGTVLRLTPSTAYQSGAAYSTSSVSLGMNATFSTQFQFRFTNPGGIDPADGITFVLAAAPTGLGAVGGGLGYQGVGNSVAVEFDTYNNGPQDGNSSNHVAIDTGGNLNNLGLTNVYGISTCAFGAPAGCLSNGDLWTANVNYDGSKLNVRVSDPSEGTSFLAISNYSINIASILGTNTAYVGFTGSTGGGWENQDVANWRFANTATLPATVPEPTSFLLFGTGAILLGCIRKPRKKIGERQLHPTNE